MQETIFGALFDPEDDRVLSVGDEVWRVTIDVVERFVVDGDFECEDYRAGDGSKTLRYWITCPESGLHDVIGKHDLADAERYFEDDADARGRAATTPAFVDVYGLGDGRWASAPYAWRNWAEGPR